MAYADLSLIWGIYLKMCHEFILRWKYFSQFISHYSGMFYAITGPEICLLLCTYVSRAQIVSKLYVEKWTIEVFSSTKWSMLWPEKIYKIIETTHSYFEIPGSSYWDLHLWPDQCWTHIGWMCEKNNSLNKTFGLSIQTIKVRK